MTDAQQREAARQFYYRWNGKGKEDEHARSYWIELLHDVLGVEDVTQRVEFEKKLIGSKGSTERIDVYIPETRVIIEQKTLGIPLDKPQPGHDNKTPYEQAKGYDNYLPFSERARWIVLDCPVKLCRDLDLRFGCEEAGTGKNDAGRAAGEVSFLCQYSKK